MFVQRKGEFNSYHVWPTEVDGYKSSTLTRDSKTILTKGMEILTRYLAFGVELGSGPNSHER